MTTQSRDLMLFKAESTNDWRVVRTLSRETWLFFTSRTEAKNRMSSALASPSVGGAAMDTPTASVDTSTKTGQGQKHWAWTFLWLRPQTEVWSPTCDAAVFGPRFCADHDADRSTPVQWNWSSGFRFCCCCTGLLTFHLAKQGKEWQVTWLQLFTLV